MKVRYQEVALATRNAIESLSLGDVKTYEAILSSHSVKHTIVQVVRRNGEAFEMKLDARKVLREEPHDAMKRIRIMQEKIRKALEGAWQK